MGYKVLDIEKSWKLSFSLDNLVVFHDDNRITIPINDVNIILIDNISTLLTTKTIIEISKKNILTVICDEKHLPSTFILPISGHYDSLKKIQKQYQWNNDFKNFKWTEIIKMKIKSQQELISFINNGIINKEKYDLIMDNIELGDSTNQEAIMANCYFTEIFGKTFKRFDETNEFNCFINSFLNYGYTVLLSIVCRSIVKNGYDTRIGLFHKSFSNHTALGSDLMEPFRVIVDKCVYRMIREIKNKRIFLTPQIKNELIELFKNHVIFNNERITILLAIDRFVHTILDTNDSIKLEYIYDQY